jgi:hypothetical protein
MPPNTKWPTGWDGRVCEYAIVSLPGSARFFSEYAYDFGVDPAQTAP